MKDRILVITAKQLHNDNRVINEANALSSFGYDVDLHCLRGKNPTIKIDKYKFNIIEFELFFQKWQKFYPFKIFKFIELILKLNIYSKNHDYDVIHAHDMSGLILAKSLRAFTHPKIKIVYDAHEYETEVNGLHGIKKLFYKITERIFIRKIDAFITVSDTIASEYQRLYGIVNSTIILNTPNFSNHSLNGNFNHFRKKLNISTDQRIFLYQGYLMKGRGIELLLEAFSETENDKNVIVFMGNGKLADLVNYYQLESDSIFYHEFVSGEVLYEYTSSADIGISFIEDISLSDRYCLPNKLFEYMNAGLPVITSNLPEMKKFVETHEIGIVANDNSVSGFVNAIQEIDEKNIQRYKNNSIATSQKINWAAQELKLNVLYSELIESTSSRTN